VSNGGRLGGSHLLKKSIGEGGGGAGLPAPKQRVKLEGLGGRRIIESAFIKKKEMVVGREK